jgi:glycosyltransferase involved in cell wall biosynthesis
MTTPLVTVAICTFNGETYLEKTLDSALAQTYPNFEIVVVDDGSTDGTTGIIERYALEHVSIRPFYRSNHGLPASRNFAFACAKGDWIAIIDQDDLCYPTRLARQIEVAERYPTAGLVFCNTHYINESDDVIGDHMSRFNLPNGFIAKGLAANLLLREGCYIDSESCFIKRETVQALGALDETLRFACDYDYFIRAGFVVDFAYSADILAAWRIHASQASKTDARRFIEVYQVYRRYLWTSDVTLRTKASLISRLSKAFTLHLLQKLPAQKGAAAT